MNKDTLFYKLKKLTGCTYEKIGKEFGISRQAVNQTFDNKSITYQNSSKYMAVRMVDKKIDEYKTKIKELEQFKERILRGDSDADRR